MNIFITGKPGCGKSTLINSLIKELKNISGIITPEIRDKYRIGFKIIDLKTKKTEILASVNIKSKYKVSKYYVNVNGIDKIIDEFLKNYKQAEYIFIDEIGKMEFFSKKFKDMLDIILKSDKKVIATLHRNYINKFKDKGEVLYLSENNFDEIKKIVLSEIRNRNI